MSFKKKVQIALIKKDWTMQDLADRMGVTAPYISDLLNGHRKSEKRIVQIKELLADVIED